MCQLSNHFATLSSFHRHHFVNLMFLVFTCHNFVKFVIFCSLHVPTLYHFTTFSAFNRHHFVNFTCFYTYTHTHIRTYAHIHPYAHTNIRTYAHTHTRTHRRADRLGYIRYSLVTWADRSVTTNDNSTNMDADKKIHCYENAISGISVPFYCNIVSS